MTENNNPLILADLSWPEVAAIRDSVDVVLIPVGSNEQHGPNLAIRMDITGATQFCNRASANVFPCVSLRNDRLAPPANTLCKTKLRAFKFGTSKQSTLVGANGAK